MKIEIQINMVGARKGVVVTRYTMPDRSVWYKDSSWHAWVVGVDDFLSGLSVNRYPEFEQLSEAWKCGYKWAHKESKK